MATKTIVIHPGEKVTLPNGTHIDALIVSGAISVTSDCDNVPPPTAQVCYQMDWSIGEDSGSPTLDQAEAAVVSIKIGGVVYTINKNCLDPTLGTSIQNISTIIPGAFDFDTIYYDDLAHRKDFHLRFKSIPLIADGIEMNIIGDGFPVNGLYVKPFESDDCA